MNKVRQLIARVRQTKVGRMFLDKKFFHYTWIGIGISAVNVVLLWLFIDIMGIPTIISSVFVVMGTFVLRYVLFDIFTVL